MTITTLDSWRIIVENEHKDTQKILDDWENEQQAALLTEKELEQQNADLVAALQGLGVTPYDYYCFCPPEMGFIHSGDHTGECREAQQALAKAETK